MNYRYAQDRNYEDFASGRVFYASPGQPAFPVRFASEILQRCCEHWQRAGGSGLCTIYDPTCGGAYWLVALAYLHWDKISMIFASDVDMDSVRLAEKNLSLLTLLGLDKRIAEIHWMLTEFGKESHAEALQSAYRFREFLTTNLGSHHVQTLAFQADSMNTSAIKKGLDNQSVDILLADVPYGLHSTWKGDAPDDRQNPVVHLLEVLLPVLSSKSVIAIVTDKGSKFQHPDYRRLEKFQVGKRKIEILRTHSRT